MRQAVVVTDELAGRRAARQDRQAEIDQVFADARKLIDTRDLELEAALAEIEEQYPVRPKRPRAVE